MGWTDFYPKTHFLTHGALAALRHATLLAGGRDGGDGFRRMRELLDHDLLRGKLLCPCAIAEQLVAVSTTVMLDISGGGAGCRNGENQRQTVGVGRCYGAAIAADVAVRVIFVAINVGRGVGLLPALFARMPVVAPVMAPIGIQVVVGGNDRCIRVDLVPAVFITENLPQPEQTQYSMFPGVFVPQLASTKG